MQSEFTAVFCKVPEGYVGFAEELPGTNAQGADLPEARANLREAIELVLEANRHSTREQIVGGEVLRECLKVTW